MLHPFHMLVVFSIESTLLLPYFVTHHVPACSRMCEHPSSAQSHHAGQRFPMVAFLSRSTIACGISTTSCDAGSLWAVRDSWLNSIEDPSWDQEYKLKGADWVGTLYAACMRVVVARQMLPAGRGLLYTIQLQYSGVLTPSFIVWCRGLLPTGCLQVELDLGWILCTTVWH